MRYTATVDIWTLNPAQRASLQPGQWVSYGENGKGRFYGEGASTVVAHYRGHERGFRTYCKTIAAYGASIRKRSH